jgi:hypothetical protein
MIRHESIVTALLGAAGIAAGIVLAALVMQALGDQGFSLALPPASLAAVVPAAILAARLNVLEVLRSE